MCVWVHPTDPAQSTIIAADKAADRIFVYDLAGKAIESLPVKHPGNIDLRYGFPLGGEKVDIVALNQREGDRVVIYRIDPATRRLARIDDGAIGTGANYGGALFRSPKSGKLYFVATSYSGRVTQVELLDNGQGKIAGRRVREWKVGLCEAALGDDRNGRIYVGAEGQGVWEIGGEPDDPAPAKLVIKIGESGLQADVEGLAIYPVGENGGYLVVSNQSRDEFKVYRREAPHAFLGTFTVKGARDTDGIEICAAHLGPRFPSGLFACHSDAGRCPVLVARWEGIAQSLPDLEINASWNPRK